MTMAPMPQAAVYQPAERPFVYACSATPIVDAPPTARPTTETMTSGVVSFLPAST